MSGSRRVFLAALAALGLFPWGLLACERGHYETRDHAVPAETTGGEGDGEGTARGDAGAGTEAGADAGVDAEAEAETGTGGDDPVGHAPEEGMQRASAQVGPVVEVTVHSATGPITLWLARRAIGLQHDLIDRCYRQALAADPEAAGSIRAVLTVEPSATIGAELETMAPELDRAVPCIDAALELTRFPAATDARPSHITLEIALSPHR